MPYYSLTFGKWKGQPIAEVPTKDLEYYAAWDKIKPEQKAEIQKELAKRRGGDGPATSGHGRPAPAPADRPSQAAAPTDAESRIAARAIDIIVIGSRYLSACEGTDKAREWLCSLVAASTAPDDDVPF